jgi:type IV secretion system protein VirB10
MMCFGFVLIYGIRNHSITQQHDRKEQDASRAAVPNTSNRAEVQSAHGETQPVPATPRIATPPPDPSAQQSHPALAFQGGPPMMQSGVNGQTDALKEYRDYQKELQDFERARRDAPLSPSSKQVGSNPLMGMPGSTGAANPMTFPPVPSGGNPAINPADVQAALNSLNGSGSLGGVSGVGVDNTGESRGDSNDIRGKQDFARPKNSSSPDTLMATLTAPLSDFEIRAGRKIPIVIDETIRSSLPGDITAIVRQDVYDDLCNIKRLDGTVHCYVEIPYLTRVFGIYNSNVTYGQDRVQVVWTRLLFPDGRSLDLDKMSGHDSSGGAGLHDKVDNHWGRIIGGVLLSSVFSAAFQISQNQSHGGRDGYGYPTPAESASMAIGQEVARVGSRIAEKNLNIPPVVTIRTGSNPFILVNKDIVFQGPYLATR